MLHRRLLLLAVAALSLWGTSGCATALVGLYASRKKSVEVELDVELVRVTVLKLDDRPRTYSLRIVERVDGKERVTFTNWCLGRSAVSRGRAVPTHAFDQLDGPGRVIEVCQKGDRRLADPESGELVTLDGRKIEIWSGGRARTCIVRPRKIDVTVGGPWELLYLALPVAISVDLATWPLQFVGLIVMIVNLSPY